MSTVGLEEQVETLTEWCIKHQKKSFLKLFDFPLAFLFWPELPILTSKTDALDETSQEVLELCDLCGKCYKPESLSLCGLQTGITKLIEEEESQDTLEHMAENDDSKEVCFAEENSDEESSVKHQQAPVLSNQKSKVASVPVNEGAATETPTNKPIQVTFAPNILLETVLFDPNEFSKTKEDKRKQSEKKSMKEVKSSSSLGQTNHLTVGDEQGSEEKPIKKVKSSSSLNKTDISTVKDDDGNDSDDEESIKRKKKCWPGKSKK